MGIYLTLHPPAGEADVIRKTKMKNIISIIFFSVGGLITISNIALAIHNAKESEKKEENYKPSLIPLVDSICFVAGFLILNFKNMSFVSWCITFLLLIAPMLIFAFAENIIVKLFKNNKIDL